MRFRPATGLVFSLATFVSGCGDDDEDGPTPGVGTCDLRDVSQKCIELHDASAIDMENQEAMCLDNDGAWSNAACPTEELVGCCEYEFGNTFRECFYTGVPGDPVAYCTDEMDGVWIEEI